MTIQLNHLSVGKHLLGFVTAVTLAVGSVVAMTPVAEAATVTVSATVNTRSGPGTNYSITGTLTKGTAITISCYSTGTSVNGNVYCDKLSNGSYVSDYYVSLGGRYPYQAGYSACVSTPKPPTTSQPSAKITSAVNWAVGIANDSSHGYDQTNRWGPNYDCSSLLISAWQQAGVPRQNRWRNIYG